LANCVALTGLSCNSRVSSISRLTGDKLILYYTR
jgi:hypothetical protein